MKDTQLDAMIFIVGMSVGLFIGLVVCTSTRVEKSEAIEHGAAQYNAQTGAFEWKVEK